jgi:hypothetical protein
MTIQPITAADVHAAGPSSTKRAPAQQSTPQMPQDTVQLSPQAKAVLDADHDGDSR